MENIKKRILWLSHFTPYPVKGGAPQRAFNMLTSCALEFQVDFVALLHESHVQIFFEGMESAIKEIEKEFKEFCSSVYLVPYGFKNRQFNKLANAIKSLFTVEPYDVLAIKSEVMKSIILSKIANNKYDLIYVDTIGLSPMLDGINIPKALNHHNIESEMLSRRASLTSFPKSIYMYWQSLKTRNLEAQYVQKYNINFTCSELDSERLLKIKDCNAVAIPNGVDTRYFKRSRQYDYENVRGAIFAGGLDWYPNASAVTFIISEIAPLLRERLSNFKITIYGKGKHPKLEYLSQGRGSNIKKGGFIDDIRPPMEDARMYLCPISDGGGTKLKVLDAMAMGIPLIAHPVSCEGIDVTEGENVIYAETPSEFVEAILFLNNNPVKCREMSKSGIDLINRKYSYDCIGKNLRTQLRQIL